MDGISMPQSPLSQATSWYPCSADTSYSTAVNVDTSEYRPRYGKTGPALELSEEHLTLTGTAGELVSGVVTAHNTGTASVYFSWRHVEPALLPGMARDTCTRFYFNDLAGVVLPGEHRLFAFVFKSPICGIFFDEWELVTVPALGSSHRIRVKAVALPQPQQRPHMDVDASAASIDTELRSRAAKKTVRDLVFGVVDSAVAKSIASHPKIKPEDELVAKFITANPSIHHSADSIARYCEIATDAGLGTAWDLSLQTLEQAIEQHKDPDTRNALVKRFEEQRLLTAVPDFQRTRPTLLAIGRMLLLDAIDELPTVWQQVAHNPAPEFRVQVAATEDGSGKQQRTFAAYLDRLRQKREEQAKSVVVAAATNESNREELQTNHHDDAQSQQQSTDQGQAERRRRRGWAR
jgi:hypothetical protein